MAEMNQKVKVWRASKTATAGFMTGENFAVMAGTKTNFVVASDTGVGISGKSISFMTTSENIRHGGLFILTNDFLRMIPQTLVTPMPSQVPYPPIGLVSNVVKDLPFFLALLAGGAIAGGAVAAAT